jgi:hypothetical protein
VRWPVIVGLLVVAIALLYYFAPDVEQEWTWITPGSALAVLGWLLASLGFAFYVNHFGSYNPRSRGMGSLDVFVSRGRFVPGIVQTECVTDQQVIGLHPIHLIDCLTASL